jgi:hypothetical protein
MIALTSFADKLLDNDKLLLSYGIRERSRVLLIPESKAATYSVGLASSLPLASSMPVASSSSSAPVPPVQHEDLPM